MNATTVATALDTIARSLGVQVTTLGGNVPGVVIHRAAAEVTITVDDIDGGVVVSAIPTRELDEAEERRTSIDPMVWAAWADAPTTGTLVVHDTIERALDTLRAAGRLPVLAAV